MLHILDSSIAVDFPEVFCDILWASNFKFIFLSADWNFSSKCFEINSLMIFPLFYLFFFVSKHDKTESKQLEALHVFCKAYFFRGLEFRESFHVVYGWPINHWVLSRSRTTRLKRSSMHTPRYWQTVWCCGLVKQYLRKNLEFIVCDRLIDMKTVHTLF